MSYFLESLIERVLYLDPLHPLLVFSTQITLIAGILWLFRRPLSKAIHAKDLIQIAYFFAWIYLYRYVCSVNSLDPRWWLNLFLTHPKTVRGILPVCLPARVQSQILGLPTVSPVDWWGIGNLLLILVPILCCCFFRPKRKENALRKQIERSGKRCPEHMNAILDRLLNETACRYRDHVRLVRLDSLSTPCTVWGDFYTIALDRIDYTDEELEMILRHEIAHISSGHFRLMLRVRSMRVICWFNPVFHLLERWVKRYIELAADEVALHSGKITPRERITYARLLVALSESTHLRGTALYLSAGVQYLRQRTEAILHPRRKRWSILLSVLVVMLMLSSSLLITPGRTEYSRTELLTFLGNDFDYAVRSVDPHYKNSYMATVIVSGMEVTLQEDRFDACQVFDDYEPVTDGTCEEIAAHIDGWITEISSALGEADIQQFDREDGSHVIKALWPVTVSDQALKRYEADPSDGFFVSLLADFSNDGSVLLIISLDPANP